MIDLTCGLCVPERAQDPLPPKPALTGAAAVRVPDKPPAVRAPGSADAEGAPDSPHWPL